ncbi:hypothetical protein RvY_09276-2 [Ramazzottius varieornatus]|uniref:G-protein coupled receptors family 1 profile domain-containing protein n=1 Tax=Ramazzottius varieornatus TaxID=947166 RepID=A0A1D1VDD2_RAMVA|nr:hypothetical protein RvY_09276-2 [Ramazzottius varieornatus]
MALGFASKQNLTDLEDASSTSPTTTETLVVYNLSYAPEVRELIHAHWFLYPPPSYAWHLALAVIVAVLAFISVTGNAAVVYIFAVTKALRNPSNALIVNLAISDFMMMATNCPPYFFSSLQGRWIFGKEACRFYGFCGALFGGVSILTMAAIAVDRYLVICKPFLIMKSAMTRQRAKFGVLAVWTYALCWAIPPLWGVNNYVLEGFLTTCTFDYLDPRDKSRIFVFSMFIGNYVTPLSIIMICYSMIVWEVYSQRKKFKKAANNLPKSKKNNPKSNEDEAKQRKEIQTAKIAVVITALWLFSWTPYATVALIGIGTDGTLLTPVVSQIPALFCKFAAVYNPIVYAVSHPRYRQALRKHFPFLALCIRDTETDRKQAQSSTTARLPSRMPVQQQMSQSSMGDSMVSEELDVETLEPAKPRVAVPRAPVIKSQMRLPHPVVPQVPNRRLSSNVGYDNPVETNELHIKDNVVSYRKYEQPEDQQKSLSLATISRAVTAASGNVEQSLPSPLDKVDLSPTTVV